VSNSVAGNGSQELTSLHHSQLFLYQEHEITLIHIPVTFPSLPLPKSLVISDPKELFSKLAGILKQDVTRLFRHEIDYSRSAVVTGPFQSSASLEGSSKGQSERVGIVICKVSLFRRTSLAGEKLCSSPEGMLLYVKASFLMKHIEA